MGQLMNLGEGLLRCGAPIDRVEDTLVRLGRAYGAVHTNVFAITSTIIASMDFEGVGELTHTRRIRQSAATDFSRLERLNCLSRELCAAPLPPDKLSRAVAEALGGCGKRWKTAVGSMLAVAGFAWMYGGTLWDVLSSALFGLGVWALQQWVAPRCPNKVFFTFLCALVTGLAVYPTVRLLPVLHADKIIIGDSMLLIPGLDLINSMRSMLMGDTVTGVIKLLEALLWAGALAGGFMLAMVLAGGGAV